MKNLYLLFFIFCIIGCTNKSNSTEKYQNKRDNIVNVHNDIKEIKIDNIEIGNNANLCLLSDYLIVGDYNSYDKLIHIFNKKTFRYLISVAPFGQGPYEISNLGNIVPDEQHKKFYAPDYGKLKIFSYDLDSVLHNGDSYCPTIKMSMEKREFPSEYIYVNDTLCYGLIVKPTGVSGFNQFTAKWNMSTGKIDIMKYAHPEIHKKRICFTASLKKGIYVECYNYHDLMSILTLDGKLKYNVYGSKWTNKTTIEISYFGQVEICKDKILATFLGGKTFSTDENGVVRSNHPTKIMIFDLNGDYVKTLETGYKISHFCYDEDNNRLILNFNDNIQFGYLNMSGLI